MLNDYQDFVVEKASPPSPLIDDDFVLLHCALGLATEVLELQQSTTRENTVEEAGDLLWYLIYTSYVLKIDTASLEFHNNATQFDPHSNTLPQEDITEDIEELLSCIKKKVIYRQNVSLEKEFINLWETFCVFCRACDLPLSFLVESNRKKLNKRYEKNFTTEESKARQDKV